MSFYFLGMEGYQCYCDPKNYFGDPMNLFDNLGVLFALISPSNYMRNIFYCKNIAEIDSIAPNEIAPKSDNHHVVYNCKDGTPGK